MKISMTEYPPSIPGLCAIRQAMFNLLKPTMGKHETHEVSEEAVRNTLIECVRRMTDTEIHSLAQYSIDHDSPREDAAELTIGKE